MASFYCDTRTVLTDRRQALKSVSAGFGFLAFAGLAAADSPTPVSALARRAGHFAANAKRVIFLCMRGGPSHVDTFDDKPELRRQHGRASAYGSPWHASPWKFNRHGESGLAVSELFPSVADHVDKMCLLRGMHCDQPSHAQAMLQMHTGTFQFVRPSLGAWTLYGLGTENQDLPGFITINPPTSTGGAQNYGSAFLPAAFQGTRFSVQDSSQRNRRIDRMRRGESNPNGINHAVNPRLSRDRQREQLDLIVELNRSKLQRDQHQPLVEGMIENYELAFRMQDAVPEVMDLSDETEQTLAMYGIGEDKTDGFGRQCLLARRFAESGVRFIELGHGSWDQHSQLQTALADNCAETDKPIAGLLSDLDQRGLLDETLVVWGGEFGRTPYSDSGTGRDHNHKGYTMWMAGGGVKGGFSYGATDPLGYEAVENKMHVHDWHATMLHLMGLDHEQLTFQHAGRSMRLTEPSGSVATDIIA